MAFWEREALIWRGAFRPSLNDAVLPPQEWHNCFWYSRCHSTFHSWLADIFRPEHNSKQQTYFFDFDSSPWGGLVKAYDGIQDMTFPKEFLCISSCRSFFSGSSAQQSGFSDAQEKARGPFSLSVHMLILFSCKCTDAICMSKCLIFHSVSILISSAAPLMEYWLLRYVLFIISF